MKPLPGGLQDHLNAGATTMCWCWKLQTLDGRVFGFTDHDNDLEFDATLFEASSGFNGSEIETGLGFKVDNLEVEGALSSLKLNENDLFAGVFDNAQVEIWQVNWQALSQRILLRSGNLGEVSRGDKNFNAEIRGLSHILNQPQGRSFHKTCDAKLGDTACKLDIQNPAFSFTASVGTVQSGKRFFIDGLSDKPTDWFVDGKLTFLSGQNTGRASEVKVHRATKAGVVIELWQSMPQAVNQGDDFSITVGCNKTFSMCKQKFSNSINFRGFPHMPGKDFVTFYPNRDDANNDGGAIVG